METYKLSVKTREKTGRGPNRRLRASGLIPASLYGQGNARSIAVSAVDFRNLNRDVGGSATVVELEDEKGESAISLVQDIQRDAVRGTINHIDFQEIERGHTFTTHVPVVLIGESDAVGVKNEGGVIDQKAHEVEIRSRPSKLPEHVEVNVAGLGVGDAIHISDLPALEDVEYLGQAEQVVVSCQPPTVNVEPATGGAEVAADEVPASRVSDQGDSSDEAETESSKS
ncbi:MAG: 50S ribosomal protein L25 [Opitutales bacterium]